MVLTDRKIIEAIEEGKLKIEPFDIELLNPNSMDFTLGSKCKMYEKSVRYDSDSQMYFDMELDCKKDNPTREFDIPEEGFVLQPNELYLFAINERISVGGDICASVMGKSSLGRLGLDIHVSAGFTDTGFSGFLVLELRTIYPLRIYPNMKICQIKFERTEGVPDVPYDKKKGSKYAGQNGVTESKMHLNFVLEELNKKVDELCDNETKESLNEFLNRKK